VTARSRGEPEVNLQPSWRAARQVAHTARADAGRKFRLIEIQSRADGSSWQILKLVRAHPSGLLFG
jgi:hypothetical protein